EIDRLKKQEEKAEQAKEKQEQQARYKQYFNQDSYQNSYQNPFISTSSSAVTLSTAEATLIEKCYKAMAVQVHPDKGGSVEDMQILNSLRDKVRKCVY
ncbi:MAG: hypothetical protein HQK72_17440, partial [Desulfamplus sp.]|nr:hypothetical protein [Desulfamplus sp.]